VSERKPYKTDLSDEQWALVEPVIAAWKAAHPSVSGHQGRYEMREIVNALLYQGRTGCQWELAPARLSAARRGEVLLLHLARRRHRPDHSRPAALAGAGEGAAEGGPEPGGARHPERARGGRGARADDGA
jgi:hypothetical protein